MKICTHEDEKGKRISVFGMMNKDDYIKGLEVIIKWLREGQ